MQLRNHRPAFLFGLMLGAVPAAAGAQAPADAQGVPADDPDANAEAEEIVVTGTAPRGSVVGDIKPEQQLSAADVRSYGVSSVADLLGELAPQTNAAGGAPVVLLNGKRISAFSEIRDIPAEAITRVEILPEEVSLKYGYAPNQKVVNIVVRQRFRALTAEVRGGTTTAGGRESGRASANLLRIQGDNRLNIDVQYSAAARLLESDRDIAPGRPRAPFAIGGNVTPVPGSGASEIDPALSALAGGAVSIAAVPASAAAGPPALADFVAGANAASLSDLGRFRTLSPSTEALSINAVLARTLPGNISGSLNASLDLTDSYSVQGLPTASLVLPAGNPFSPFADPVQLYRYLDQAGALGQSIRGTTAHIGLALNGDIKPWRWS
ncbi:MAG: hypothetical protein JWM38_1715, partial [Sphingomonas bacterium]|nr:hypothetical protein [Sphingomonas bacterium]